MCGEKFMKYMDRFVFKARCSAVLLELEKSGEPVTITKDGTPYVRLVPFTGVLDSSVKPWKPKKATGTKRNTKT